MAKKRKKKHAPTTPTGRNRHHLLYQGRYWNKGMAKELRLYFVYYLPIAIHDQIHNYIISDIPRPPPEAMKPLYLAFKEQKDILDQLDVIGALEWLRNACNDEPFKDAITKQLNFLKSKLGSGRD